MDTSSLVAATGAGVIFGVYWIGSILYLFSYDKRESGTSTEKSHVYSWTFHVESLRFWGMINFCVVVIAGGIMTNYSGIDTIEDPEETVIFELFGVNHSCNYIDHNPVRMLAAILLLPLVQVPFMLYTLLWHLRVAKSAKLGEIPHWLLNLSRVLSPFNFITMSQLHLWFVNNPNDTYGFTAHYIPYLMFQITISLYNLLNILYLTYKGGMPWGIPKGVAWAYWAFFTIFTTVYAVFVISTLAGAPIIDARRSAGEEVAVNVLSLGWAVMALLGTLVLSGKERLNGDNLTLTIGDGIFQVENASGDGEEALLEDEPKAEEGVDVPVEQAHQMAIDL